MILTRLNPALPPGGAGREGSATMSREAIVETLNELIEACKDGEYGFTACARHVSSAQLRLLLTERADDCIRSAEELQSLVVRFGGEPETEGSGLAALHRGWLAMRSSLAGYSDQAMLAECEREEDLALARYRAALGERLPEDVRAVVARQQLGVLAQQDQIKRLRDGAR